MSGKGEFDPINTRKGDFFSTKSEKMTVDFMTMTFIVNYFNGSDYSVISVPYTGKQYAYEKDGLNDLKRSFSPTMANEIETTLALTKTLVQIPRFTIQ